MKNNKIHFASLAMAIVAIAIMVVSCKKETTNEPSNDKNPTVQSFNPNKIEDMDAYLKDFKQKIQTAVKGNDETLSLEDAAWHLSSLANYDFGHVNVDYSDIRIDTIYGHLEVNQGTVSLSQLSAAYATISEDIDTFYQSLDNANKHFRFIDITVATDGEMTIRLITTYTVLDHVWYYDDVFEADSICDVLLSEDSIYTWNTTAVSELNRILNLIEHHNISSVPSAHVYYTKTRDVEFKFYQWEDPYGSPFALNSRLYSWGNPYHDLSVDQMCYCIDSYAGLGYQYMIDYPLVNNEHPACWLVTSGNGYFQYHWWSYYHNLTVTYAQYNIGSGNSTQD